MNGLNTLMQGLLGGNVKGDVTVNVQFDPSTSFFLAVLIFMVIVGSHWLIKFIG